MGNVHMEATQINYRGGSKKMNVEEAIKAAGTEITPEEKTWIDSIPTLTTGKADNGVIAPEFDSEEGVYAIGDLVMHEGKLYEFTTAHETAGDWDSTEVTEKTVADEINSLESGLTNITICVGVTKQITLASEASGSVNVQLSDFTIPSGYMFQPATLVVCVYGSWGVTPKSVGYAYTDGDDVLTANNSLRVDITSNASGGNVNYRVNTVAYCTKVTS